MSGLALNRPGTVESVKEKIWPKWEINDLVSYAETASMGLGVVAQRRIEMDTEILCDPVRTFTGDDAARIRSTEAYHILFVDRETFDVENKRSPLHLVVGPISILNHSKNANCHILWEIGEDVRSPRARLFARRDILPGEQLVISYHNIEEYDFD